LNDDVSIIDFGLGVVRGTTDFDVVLPFDEMGVFIGISVRELSRENFDFYETTYFPGDAVNVMRGGRAYVVCETSFTEGGAVYMRYVAGAGGTKIGAFRNNADSGTAILINNAQFISNGIDNNTAIVWLEYASVSAVVNNPYQFQGGLNFQFQGGAQFDFNL
jgi:hypothetical protein